MTEKNSLFILAFLLAAVLSAPSLAAPFEPKGQISKPQPAFDPSELSKETGEDAGYQDIAGIGSISSVKKSNTLTNQKLNAYITINLIHQSYSIRCTFNSINARIKSG